MTKSRDARARILRASAAAAAYACGATNTLDGPRSRRPLDTGIDVPDDPIHDRVTAAIRAWLDDEDRLFREPLSPAATSWDDRRLEYRFAARAPAGDDALELAAREYPGGRLDWYHFDVARQPKDKTVWPGTERLRVLPAPLRFHGMAASRWWEFEPGDVYFGDLAAAPDDLARSVVASYAALHGDDWYVIPCRLPAGSVAQATRVAVVDDFGLSRTLRPLAVTDGASRVWRWFELTGDRSVERGRAPLLLLPPTLADADRSRPLEVVELVRDEAANVGWAIEHKVQSASGRPASRAARESGPAEAPAGPSDVDAWAYRLNTAVRGHWYPLLSVRMPGARPEIALRRGRTPDTERPPLGRVIAGHPFVVHEEEIPDSGLIVERHYELARSVDGDVHVWVGRRRRPVGGPKPSPATFDRIIE